MVEQDWLVEIGTEELPPQALEQLSEALGQALQTQLAQQHLAHGSVECFATPRRLAVRIHSVPSKQPDREQLRRGPALQAAFDGAGNPTRAALGFARSCGVDVSDLQRLKNEKGAWLLYRQRDPGKETRALAAGMIEEALKALPIPKRMRWGDREESFVRPVHWVLSLLGGETVPGTLFGIEIGSRTRGHRFHHPQWLEIPEPAAYETLLREKAWVEPSFARRRDRIRQQVEALARTVSGVPVLEESLLDEVTALCEWPVALLGQFDEHFLRVPPEVLMEAMQKHQKYFPLRDTKGALLPYFITISNIESRDPQQVRAGNERVIRPRFADAAFFWDQDRKQPLADYAPGLHQVLFQEKLGSLGDKSERVARIARWIAQRIGFDEEIADRAARLSKCDLLTQMVGEFPRLQGIMGRYYGEHSGEDPRICLALEEQYLPRQAGDRLPSSDCGRILSLADRLDSLLGIFAIGQKPSGVKDPYGLRRAAIGLLRILIETPLPLDLREMLAFCGTVLQDRIDTGTAQGEVLTYVLERLRGYYQEQGVRGDFLDAVLATGIAQPSDLDRRIQAVRAFAQLPEAAALSAANKRIRNLLKKADQPIPDTFDAQQLQEPAEVELSQKLAALRETVQALIQKQAYGEALQQLASLRPAVDRFFDAVMVMVEDERVRNNRLALLAQLEGLFLGVADISRLRGEP